MDSQLVEQLHSNYKVSLKEKAQTLQDLWSKADEDSAALLRFLHQLAGSAGMYGFDEISQQANLMQSSIKESQSKLDIENAYHCLYTTLIENSLVD